MPFPQPSSLLHVIQNSFIRADMYVLCSWSFVYRTRSEREHLHLKTASNDNITLTASVGDKPTSQISGAPANNVRSKTVSQSTSTHGDGDFLSSTRSRDAKIRCCQNRSRSAASSRERIDKTGQNGRIRELSDEMEELRRDNYRLMYVLEHANDFGNRKLWWNL